MVIPCTSSFPKKKVSQKVFRSTLVSICGSPTLSSSGSWWPIFPNANWDCASAWMASWMIFKNCSQFKPRPVDPISNLCLLAKKCFKRKESLALRVSVFFGLKTYKIPPLQPRTPNLEPMADNGPLKDAGVGSPSWSPELRLDH